MEAPPPPAESRPRRTPPWRWILWSAVAALCVGLVLFFVGLQRGRSQVGALEGQLDRARREQVDAGARLARSQDRARMAHALALLYRTTLDLDARNFGTAGERLNEAARVLSGVREAPEGLDALRRQIAGVQLEVARDLQDQRARVVDFATRLEALLPPPDAPAPSPPDTTAP